MQNTQTTFSITSTMNIAIAGGRTAEPNLMDRFLQKQSTSQTPQLSRFRTAPALSAFSTDTINNNALVFSRGDSGVNITAFNNAFSLDKTLTNIRNTSNETTTDNSNAQLLGSLFNTLNTTSKANGFVNIPLQVRDQEVNLNPSDLINNDMLPTAIFNRFDLSASSGEHCGEYRIVYHKNSGAGRFFLIFEAQYPNPEPEQGPAGCFAVADFWQKVGQKTKVEALIELEKFFYQGLKHNGVSLPAAINFTHYTHGTGQVRSNQFVDGPWQLREFKTNIDASGKAVFVADTVKSNPLTELFVSAQDSDALKASRIYFNNDFNNHYIDNLLTPERQSDSPSATSIINGFSLGSDNHYNEFQSDSSSSDNTARPSNAILDTAINNKLTDLGLSSYTPQMIRNRAEAMSCGGCHQNNNGAEIAPNVHWPRSGFFVHVNEQGNLSSALTEQFLPARAALLENYLQETEAQRCGPACQLGSASSHGGFNSCAIKFDNTIECWGNNNNGQSTVPNGLIAKQIALGLKHSCAIKFDNTVECWGNNNNGQSTVPNGLIAKQIALGLNHSCAIKFDNTVECWGDGIAPADLLAKQIALGVNHSCAIKPDNSVTCWNRDSSIRTITPAGLEVKQIATGSFHSCAIKIDDSVVCWGRDSSGQSAPPINLVAKQIALGALHSCAIKLDDSVICWGLSDLQITNVPVGLIAKKVSLGSWHSCAIKHDNSVACWGDNTDGRSTPPEDLIAKQL